MKRQDARKLDHKTLEEIRIRAVQQVQNGESPETVIRANLGGTWTSFGTQAGQDLGGMMDTFWEHGGQG
jgi:hypothetical protein